MQRPEEDYNLKEQNEALEEYTLAVLGHMESKDIDPSHGPWLCDPSRRLSVLRTPPIRVGVVI